MSEPYIFKSKRLGFRTWKENDLIPFAKMNADPEVMKHFPKTLSTAETAATIERFTKHYQSNGYQYFAVDLLSDNEFIGFIGMAYQTYESPFGPATDIGWRLKKSAWGHGYATEGALRCLSYAFDVLELRRIVSICTIQNKPSENVMQKIGMQEKGIFKHPKLKDFPDHEVCKWYEIVSDER